MEEKKDIDELLLELEYEIALRRYKMNKLLEKEEEKVLLPNDKDKVMKRFRQIRAKANGVDTNKGSGSMVQKHIPKRD